MYLKRNSFESMNYTEQRTKDSSKSPNCFMNFRNAHSPPPFTFVWNIYIYIYIYNLYFRLKCLELTSP